MNECQKVTMSLSSNHAYACVIEEVNRYCVRMISENGFRSTKYYLYREDAERAANDFVRQYA